MLGKLQSLDDYGVKHFGERKILPHISLGEDRANISATCFIDSFWNMHA